MSTLVILLLVDVVLGLDDVEMLPGGMVVGRESLGAGEGFAEEEEAEVGDDNKEETKCSPSAVAVDTVKSAGEAVGREERENRAYVRRTP